MVICQSSELGWEVTVELPADFLSLGRGSVRSLLPSMEVVQVAHLEKHPHTRILLEVDPSLVSPRPLR